MGHGEGQEGQPDPIQGLGDRATPLWLFHRSLGDADQHADVIGDGAFYAQPVEGKTVKLPFGDSWVELMKNVKRGALSNLKSFEAKGAPYVKVANVQ